MKTKAIILFISLIVYVFDLMAAMPSSVSAGCCNNSGNTCNMELPADDSGKCTMEGVNCPYCYITILNKEINILIRYVVLDISCNQLQYQILTGYQPSQWQPPDVSV